MPGRSSSGMRSRCRGCSGSRCSFSLSDRAKTPRGSWTMREPPGGTPGTLPGDSSPAPRPGATSPEYASGRGRGELAARSVDVLTTRVADGGRDAVRAKAFDEVLLHARP